MAKEKDGPSFQLYAADLYVDTNEWSCEELGAYTRLLMSQWVNGDLPSDEERLKRITLQDAKSFRKVSATVLQKFKHTEGGRLINLRLEETRQNQRIYREQQKNKANALWKKRNAAADAPAEAPAEAPASAQLMPEGLPNVCPSSSSSYILPKGNIKEICIVEQPAVEPILPEPPKRPKKVVVYDEETKAKFQKVVDYLNEKTGRNFSWRTVKTQECINARINEGNKFVDFQYVIDNKTKQWGTDERMCIFLRPETLFGPKFEGYLNEAPLMPSSQSVFLRG
jgi:uncharacterized phage protein (TIGR02220 family)